MIRALLFDMGGTLDGDGVHWLDRFDQSYAAVGLTVPRDDLRAAFDEAERRASTDDQMGVAGFEAMVARHLDWQLEYLSSCQELAPACAAWHSPEVRRRVASDVQRRFVEPVRRAVAANVGLLAELKARGFVLGVVSNGCGNVDRLCDDFGYTRFLSTIVDSRRVGLQKPDPAIYQYAVGQLGLPPSAIMMIGDSFERDIRPAASIGMRTAWLQGAGNRPCPDPALVDVRLDALGDLLRALEAPARTFA